MHELEIIDGQAQMAYVGETPWHGLGVRVSNDLTPAQMMKKAGLDWDVKKYTLAAEVKGKRVKSDKMALVRTSDSRILSTVGSDWEPVQNSDAFDFFHEFVLAGDMEMHTAGSLRNGEMVWALAKTTDSFDIFGGDVVESYLLFSNPHQYGKSVDIRFTQIRVVCNNTLTFATNTTAKLGFKSGHRTAFDPELAKETMGLAHEKFSKYKEMAEFLGSKKASASDLLEYYATVFPKTSGNKEDVSRNAKLAMEILHTQPGAEYAEGSWWQAYNSVTFLTDHIQGRSNETRLYNQWFGGNQAKKVTALHTAVKMAEAA